MCRVLQVSRSGFYQWQHRQSRPVSGRRAANQMLLTEIRRIQSTCSAYGSPRIHQQLRNAQVTAGRHRIAKLMRDNNIRARRGPVKSRSRAAPPRRRPEITDRVRREFTRTEPNHGDPQRPGCFVGGESRTKQRHVGEPYLAHLHRDAHPRQPHGDAGPWIPWSRCATSWPAPRMTSSSPSWSTTRSARSAVRHRRDRARRTSIRRPRLS